MNDIQLTGSIHSPREVLEILFRRKVPIMLLYFSVILVCLLYVFFWPPTYRASVRFLIKNTRQETTISANPNVIRTNERQPVSEDDLNSESAILLSHTVIEKTVEQAGIDKMREYWALRLLHAPLTAVRHLYDLYHGKPDRTPFGRGVKRLMTNASVSVEQRSDILTLNVDWGDPRLASQIADIMAKNYLAQHLAVRTNPAALSDFFRDQVLEKQKELQQIASRIDSSSSVGGLDALVHERSNDQDEAMLVDKERTSDRASLAKLYSQVRAQQSTEGHTPHTVIATDRSVVNEQALSSLRLQIVELERARVELLHKYEPDNRFVTQNAQELAIAKESLKEALVSPAHEKTAVINPILQMLQTQSATDKVEVAGTRAHQAALTKAQRAIQSRLKHLKDQQTPVEQLDLEKRSAEAAYLAYARQYDENRINNALDDSRFSNVVMIEPVRVGDSPIKPAAKLIFELALPLGLLGAIGYGFLLEFLDHTVKSAMDVVSLNAPALATFRMVAPQSDSSSHD